MVVLIPKLIAVWQLNVKPIKTIMSTRVNEKGVVLIYLFTVKRGIKNFTEP